MLVKDAIASANREFSIAQGIPREADARSDFGMISSHTPVRKAPLLAAHDAIGDLRIYASVAAVERDRLTRDRIK
jgi:hypothetical protein